jgi:F-type H+-transporting ATPase subunit a
MPDYNPSQIYVSATATDEHFSTSNVAAEGAVAAEDAKAMQHSEPAEAGPPEVANFITVLTRTPLKDTPVVKFLHHWENPVFSWIIVILIGIVVVRGTRRRLIIPSRFQNFLELVVEKFYDFLCGILGKENGRRFLPYLGSLFIFILINNLCGIVPFMKAPTSSYRTTIALALCTFFYVQYVAVTKLGLLGYLHHLMGEPRDIISWCMVPLMFPMHIIEEVAKPVSLSLRLFGNVLGEDVLVGAFVFLGIMVLGAIGLQSIPVGLPFQILVLPLVVILSTVQATVFAVLSTIYILLVLPHEEQP